MNATLDTPAAAQFFAELTASNAMPRNSWAARERRVETRTELLAYELVRYAPRLAQKLAVAGQQQLVDGAVKDGPAGRRCRRHEVSSFFLR